MTSISMIRRISTIFIKKMLAIIIILFLNLILLQASDPTLRKKNPRIEIHEYLANVWQSGDIFGRLSIL